MSYREHVGDVLDSFVERLWFGLGRLLYYIGVVLVILAVYAFCQYGVLIFILGLVAYLLNLCGFSKETAASLTVILTFVGGGLVWLMALGKPEQEGPPDQGA